MAEVVQHTPPRARSTYFQLYPDRLPPSKDGSSSRASSRPASPDVSAASVLAKGKSNDRETGDAVLDKGKERESLGKEPPRSRKHRTGSISSLLSLATGKDKARERDPARESRDQERASQGDSTHSRRPSATSVYLGRALESLTVAGDVSGLPTTPKPRPRPTSTSPRLEDAILFRPLSPASTSSLRPLRLRHPSGSSVASSSSSSFASAYQSHDDTPRSPHLSIPLHSSPEQQPPRSPRKSLSFQSSIFPSLSRATSVSSAGSQDSRSPILVSNVFPTPPRRISSRASLSPATSFTSLSSVASLPHTSPRFHSEPLHDLFAGPATVNLKLDVRTGSYVAEGNSRTPSVEQMDDLADAVNGTKSKPSSVRRLSDRSSRSGSGHDDGYSSSLYEGVGNGIQPTAPRQARTREATVSSVASEASFASMTAGPTPNQALQNAAPPMSRGDTLRPRVASSGTLALAADAELAQDFISAIPVVVTPTIDDIINNYRADMAKASQLKPPRPARAPRLSPSAPALSRTASAPISTSKHLSPAPSHSSHLSSSTSGPADRIKSIDEIIREHAAAAPIKRGPPPLPPTPAQALAAAARETGYESDESETSVNSIDEEIRHSLWDEHSLVHAKSFPGSSPSLDSSDLSDTRSNNSGFSAQPTPRGGSPAHESEAAHVERELATLLKSPRLTRLLSLQRSPNQGLTVSLADVGSSHGHPVIVFLGLGCVRYLIALYDEMADALGLRLICIDRWGLGRTGEVADDKRGFMEWATVVDEVADQLDLRQFSILAHSAGGPYGLAASLRAPDRVRGSIHLLAPWVSTSADSLAGAYKYLKYVPTGVLRTAQAAEFKMQAWRLGKPPTIVQHGIGYNHRAAISSQDSHHGPVSASVSSPASPVAHSPMEFGTLEEEAGEEDDGSDHPSILSNPESAELAVPLTSSLPQSLPQAGRVAANGRSVRGKSSKTFLGGIFGGHHDRPSKHSTSPDNASLRSTSGGSRTGPSTPTRTFTPPSSLRPASHSPAHRRSSTISTSTTDLDRALSPPPPTSPIHDPFHLSGLDLANGLLRASHAESLKGSTSDLMVILERTHKPWGFRYSDVETPVKVWHGDKDDRISLSSVKWLETEMPDCKVTVVEGADHSMMTNGRVMIQVLESIASQW